MSSFKKRAKSVQRQYRERSQPVHRKHLGFLEKHRDYIERANSYKRKAKQLKILQEKARNRNPDEFYYKMVNIKLQNGQHKIPQPEENYSTDQLKIMKTQDMKYIQMKLAMERNKIEKLKPFVKHNEAVRCNTHLVFVDNEEEADVDSESNNEEDNGGHDDQDDADISDEEILDDCNNSKSTVDGDGAPFGKELMERSKRAEKLKQMMSKMQMQKYLMNKKEKCYRIAGSKDGRPITYKWKSERKR